MEIRTEVDNLTKSQYLSIRKDKNVPIKWNMFCFPFFHPKYNPRNFFCTLQKNFFWFFSTFSFQDCVLINWNVKSITETYDKLIIKCIFCIGWCKCLLSILNNEKFINSSTLDSKHLCNLNQRRQPSTTKTMKNKSNVDKMIRFEKLTQFFVKLFSLISSNKIIILYITKTHV